MRYSAILLFLLVFGFGAATASAQCDPATQGAIKCSYYNEGYQDGVSDANNYRNRDYKRYRDKYERRYEDTFRDGYNAGFDSVRPMVRWTSSQRSAYDSGYNIGQNDRRRSGQNRTANESYRYDPNISLYFQQGYNDGFDGRARMYDVPVGGVTPPIYPPINPPYPGGGGTATGNATWSGRVDDRGNIVIRGNTIYAENVSGNGVRTINQNMNGVLPRRAANITARRASGRGSVTVIQQPSRENNFTAIVQVHDPKGGADNYRVDISWVATRPVEEPYSSGNVRWRGRVDQTVQITIAGSDVQSRDMTLTGLSNVDFSINGYLASRPGTVNVRKRNGRGTVTVLQQPSDYNGYVAIIQIFDPNGGADDYDLEISW